MGETIAIIPARGGSKGLPGKNLKSFAGKPMIAWTIEAALNAEAVDRVIVTTDDMEIAEVSLANKAEVPFMRPDELATDESKVYDAIEYTLERYKRECSVVIETLIVLQPTSPLRTSKHIEEALELYRKSRCKSLISVTKTDHPIAWEMVITDEGTVENYFGDKMPTNRQSYKETYHPNGMIYIHDYKKFIENKGRANDAITPYIVLKPYSVDIDDQHDFEYAEFLFQKLSLHTNK